MKIAIVARIMNNVLTKQHCFHNNFYYEKSGLNFYENRAYLLIFFGTMTCRIALELSQL